jgi:rod shape-determining protein MreB
MPALAVDLGSATAGIWAADHGAVSAAHPDGPVRRGRVIDVDSCVTLLTRLADEYAQPVTADVVVACQPVGASPSEQAQLRTVIDNAFAPGRTILIDSVRAAAIGAGAAAGTLLIADIGAELTETALLRQGRVVAARRAEFGTRDLGRDADVDLLSDIVVRHLDHLRAGADPGHLAAATERGLLLVGDGALHPALPEILSSACGLRVHRAAAPRTAALDGAGRAAMSALRHPAFRKP